MTREERRDKESWFKSRKCLDCKRTFMYPFQAHDHRDETGHKVEETCWMRHPRTKTACIREQNHPGKHAYVGQNYTVYFEKALSAGSGLI